MNKLKGLSDKKREEIAAVAETIEHNGNLVRKVDRKSKTGDFVRFSNVHSELTSSGKLYEVYDEHFYTGDGGKPCDVYGWLANCPDPEIFEVVGNDMVSMNEISALVKRLRTIIINSDSDVLGIHLSTIGDDIQLESIAFLTEFIDFDIVDRKCEEYQYEFSSRIGGVKFCAVMSAEDIIDLKTTIPDQFEYISSKVQMDIEGR